MISGLEYLINIEGIWYPIVTFTALGVSFLLAFAIQHYLAESLSRRGFSKESAKVIGGIAGILFVGLVFFLLFIWMMGS